MIRIKITVALLVFVLVSGACSLKQDNKEKITIDQEKVDQVSIEPTDILTMEVKGMSCEMGCGATIRKALLATKAVDRVKFDFKMGREVNVAEITYDKSQISADKIASIMGEINEQQFSVHAVSDTPISPEH